MERRWRLALPRLPRLALAAAVALAISAAASSADAQPTSEEPGSAPQPAPAPGRRRAPAPRRGEATTTVPPRAPTAPAIPNPPPVIGPGLTSSTSPAVRLENAPPDRDRSAGQRSAGEHVGETAGTGTARHGGAEATADRLPSPPDAVLGTAAPPASRSGPVPDGSLQACVDRELARRGLNAFGDPPATEYPGGTPVPASSIERYDHVLRRSPAIRTACRAPAPFR